MGDEPVATAAMEYGKYDYVVFGGEIEKITHPAHDATIQIIAHGNAKNTVFFGYIDLGVTKNTKNYSMTEIKTRINEWIVTGVKGIFFDDFGYDYSVSRSRQNEAVSYVHSKGISVIANAWDPDDVFGSQYDSNYNPNSTKTVLTSQDFYLYESYQIKIGEYVSKNEWHNKINKLKNYQNIIKFKILATTTNDLNNIYDEDKFFYAWYSSLLDEIEALAWGEYLYCVLYCVNGDTPFRERPDFDCGNYFTSNLIEDQDWFYRNSDKGQIKINTTTHEFMPCNPL